MLKMLVLINVKLCGSPILKSKYQYSLKIHVMLQYPWQTDETTASQKNV